MWGNKATTSLTFTDNLGLDLSFDGLTSVITASKMRLSSGLHTVKFVVADGRDPILDAGVFIQGGSFGPVQTAAVPEPSTVLLLSCGLAGLAGPRLRMKRK